MKRRKKAKKSAVLEPFERDAFILAQNRGVERRILFNSKEDYDRFEGYLYLLNSVESPRAANFFADDRSQTVFEAGRGDRLVAIGAYTFTPREFKLLLTAVAPQGIAKFMQKLQTAYTMYFNHKYRRSGRLFESKYRSQTATSHEHLKYLYATTHLSAAALFDEYWEELVEHELMAQAIRTMQYRYSSIEEYRNASFRIVEPSFFPLYLRRAKDATSHVRFRLGYKGE